MSRILRVFDLSSYCHAGNVNKRAFFDGPIVELASGYTQRNVPAGGVSLLFNQLYYYMGECDMVFCADRNPTIKKGMYPQYKESRVHARDIEIQKEVMERVLALCGFTVLYEEGYEADDFIYSVVTKMKDQYDHVYIHTGDSDLYFLVSDNVSIAKTHSRTKEVTMENYSYMFKKGKFTPYNMITFMKVLNGDTSDDIPAMPVEKAQPLLDMFDSDFYRVRMGDKNFMRASVEFAAPWALPQFDLVYPLDTPVPEELGYGDKQLVSEFGYAMKNKLFDGNVRVYSTVEAAINQMAEDGLYID